LNVEFEVDQAEAAVDRIAEVATRRQCACFGDLLWSPFTADPSAFLDNPGVMFESSRRVVVFQEISGELRYYAGGWCPDQNRLHLEQDRVWAEGSESGVFATVTDALAFTEQYLTGLRGFLEIRVPRRVLYGRDPE